MNRKTDPRNPTVDLPGFWIYGELLTDSPVAVSGFHRFWALILDFTYDEVRIVDLSVRNVTVFFFWFCLDVRYCSIFFFVTDNTHRMSHNREIVTRYG